MHFCVLINYKEILRDDPLPKAYRRNLILSLSIVVIKDFFHIWRVQFPSSDKRFIKKIEHSSNLFITLITFSFRKKFYIQRYFPSLWHSRGTSCVKCKDFNAKILSLHFTARCKITSNPELRRKYALDSRVILQVFSTEGTPEPPLIINLESSLRQ